MRIFQLAGVGVEVGSKLPKLEVNVVNEKVLISRHVKPSNSNLKSKLSIRIFQFRGGEGGKTILVLITKGYADIVWHSLSKHGLCITYDI